MQNVPIDEKNYPKELKTLLAKRKKVYIKPPKFKQELLDQIDLKYGSPEVKGATKIIQFNAS